MQYQDLEEQDAVLKNTKKNMLVSASAGSGKTYIMIKYICNLIVKKRVPINKLLVLTFTKAAATQMKDRLTNSLKQQQVDDFILQQMDALPTANISTIHAFCEKSLKKYASLIGLNESFSLIDENLAKNLQESAFETAYKQFEQSKNDLFQFVNASYKNNKNSIRDIIFEIQKLADVVADKEKFLKDILDNFEESFSASAQFLCQDFQNMVKKKLSDLEKLHVDRYETQMRTALQPVLSAQDLFQLDKAIRSLKFPSRPAAKTIGEEITNQIIAIKKVFDDKIKLIKALNLFDEENVKLQRSGVLEKAVLSLFEDYLTAFNNLKNAQNCLDFCDLEKYMKILSQKENLFDGFEYVFVDEYQDTNKIQEEIIKNIAKNCNFVAVGDLKQGIYGFRLASAEIFLKDMEGFQKDDDSAVNLLKSNFRSSPKVLEFVNNIFKVCMTKETANVDYLGTSMLEGRSKFVDDGVCPVNIDIVLPEEFEGDDIPKVYSVKQAPIFEDKRNQNLLLDIKRRINEVLSSKISVEGKLRKATYKDIAILARSRDAVFNQLEAFLQENGIPVMSNSKSYLLEEPEIQVLHNYLKIALNLDDEIALLSVLTSGLYRYPIESILQEKQQKNLLEAVSNPQSVYFEKFNSDLAEFRTNFEVYGAKIALLKLFAQTNYRSYINLRPDKEKLNLFVDRFLEEVEKLDFDLPKLVQYFDTVQIPVTPEISSFGDYITLTTVHGSKGLEYPVVFLLGCDKSLSKQKPKPPVEINEKFGLALKNYDVENNTETISVRMRAIKESQKQKNFIEEMMIFYVALTRAKNRLYLFGQYDSENFEKYVVQDCDCYFDFIFFALKNEKRQFLQQNKFESPDLCINLIEEVKEKKSNLKQSLENAETDADVVEKIKNYLDFSYPFSEIENFRLKESVTSLNNKNDEAKFEKYSFDGVAFSEKFVETGNAYHLALKSVDFENLNSLDDLQKQLNDYKDIDKNLIDPKILWENIKLLKKLTEGGKIYKEKEFLMKEKISNMLGAKIDNAILVQGIVDLFVVKENEILLVDYKYTSSQNEQYLIDKYQNQLKLYKIALENAFQKPVKNVFLLSLKQAKLIKVEV